MGATVPCPQNYMGQIPEDSSLHSHCRENRKLRKILISQIDAECVARHEALCTVSGESCSQRILTIVKNVKLSL
jgi:hypothetical protein